MIDEEFAAGPPVNESEQRALATLRAELSSAAERFTLVTNVRLPNGRHDFYEYDAIAVGERMVFAVEVKGYAGRIVCQRDRWFFEDGKAYENPSNAISTKAKTLSSLLQGKYRNLRSRLWVQDLVYVNGPGAKLTDADYARRTNFDVIGTAFDSAKALGSALRDSQRWYKTEPFSKDERETIVNYLRGGDPRRVDEHLGKYAVVEHLTATSERYERLLVRDRFQSAEAAKFELHVYPLDGRRATSLEIGTLFQRQIEIVRALGDSGVAARYISDDAGPWHGQEARYIAYEWLGAFETLGDRIARTGPPGLVEGLRLGVALADAIATLHEQGLVHGALEPSSLYLRPPSIETETTSRIALGRIELARPQNAGMSVSAISTVSTAASCYASPNVLANKRPAVDDDLFSFGAILAHLLRGRPLFASPNEILRQIRLPRLIEDRSTDPPELVELVMALLSRSALSRPRSMRDVATRLRALLVPLEARRHDPARIGEYQIVRELRAGATGRTVVAERPDLLGEVVLKLAPLGCEETLRHEVESLRALQSDRVHPNIVFAYDAKTLEDEKLLVGVFGLIPGEDGERVRGKIRAGWLHPLVDGLLGALAFVHGHSLLHRDIKPANIMVGPDGKATLLDFGLAAPPGDTNLVIGTAPYKPERLFERGTWSFADDVFAAVTSLWEIATGRHPWSGDAPQGEPTLEAADLGGVLDDRAKARFTAAALSLLQESYDGPDVAERARTQLLATLVRSDARLELALPYSVEVPPGARASDSIAAAVLSKPTRRALDDLGVATLADVLRLENAQFAGVRAFGRGVSDEIAALRIALEARFGEPGPAARSVLRSVQQIFAPALATDADAARERIDVLGLPPELAGALAQRGVVSVADLASLDPTHLERDERIGASAVAAIREALHAYVDDRPRLVAEAALPPWSIATRASFIEAVARVGGDPAKAIDLLEEAGGFEVAADAGPALREPLVAAPPWTLEGLLAALAQIEANVSWPPVDLAASSRGVVTPASLTAEAAAFFVERVGPLLSAVSPSADGRWYRSGAPSVAEALAYGAGGAPLPLPLAAFLSEVERRLPGLRLPAAGEARFENDLADAGLMLLPNANVERVEAYERARPTEPSKLEGAEVVPLSAAAQALITATRAGGYRLVVAEPSVYASRTRALVAELNRALGPRMRVVDVDAELCRALRATGSLEMAIRVQNARGLERGALEAIAGDTMRSILDGLLSGERDTLTIAINTGSLGLVGVSNHLGAIYDAARGGRCGLIVVCVPGDHPSEHARLNRQIPLPVQPTEKPMALEAVA